MGVKLNRQQKIINKTVRNASNDYEIRRATEKIFVKGRAVIKDQEFEQIKANVQPYNGKTEDLPTGTLSEDIRSLFIPSVLVSGLYEPAIKKDDILVVNGEFFRVKSGFKDWTSHIEAEALRTGENSNKVE